MAVNSLKDLGTQYIVGGLLLTCMLAFAISFMLANNPAGFGDDGTGDSLNSVYSAQSALLEATPDNADKILNITANTNPEASDLGSRDSVSTSYSTYGNAKAQFESAMVLMSWVFSGPAGKMLITVLGGLIGLVAGFAIFKYIRTGD